MLAASRITELEQENTRLDRELQSLTQQLDWFKRQLFGAKSEKQLEIDPSIQNSLFASLGVEAPPPKPDTETVTYQRRKKCRDGAMNDSGLRFDDSVPRKVIRVTDPEFEALLESERDIIGEKVSYRLAQRSASYVILEYHRLVYKRLTDNKVMTTPAPDNVLEKSSVDVSLLVGLLIDKFCYHLPLYRQHQRIQQSGIQLSRSSLTHWVSRAIDLLIPIVESQYQHLLQSQVLAMDETPIKAGRQSKGKMRQAYLWPMFGDNDEIVFRYAPLAGAPKRTELAQRLFRHSAKRWL